MYKLTIQFSDLSEQKIITHTNEEAIAIIKSESDRNIISYEIEPIEIKFNKGPSIKMPKLKYNYYNGGEKVIITTEG